jgi:hypothetical protein
MIDPAIGSGEYQRVEYEPLQSSLLYAQLIDIIPDDIPSVLITIFVRLFRREFLTELSASYSDLFQILILE